MSAFRWFVLAVFVIACASAQSAGGGGGGGGGYRGGSYRSSSSSSRSRLPSHSATGGHRSEYEESAYYFQWVCAGLVVLLLAFALYKSGIMCDAPPRPALRMTPDHAGWSGQFVGSRGANAYPHTTRAVLRFQPSPSEAASGVLTVDGRGDDTFGAFTVLGELTISDRVIRFEKQYVTGECALVHYTGSLETDLCGTDPHKLSGKWTTANGYDSGEWSFQAASANDERTIQRQFQNAASAAAAAVSRLV